MKLRFFDIENWREIGATLARNKTRTFLTAFGIFWGTAMLGMLWGGANGFTGIMSRNFAGLSTNMGGIFPGTRSISYKGFNKGTYWGLTEDDLKAVRTNAPYLEYSSGVTNVSGTAAYNDKSAAGRVIGIEPDYGRICLPIIEKGRFINEADYSSSAKVVVVGKSRADDLFGPEDPTGKYISINGVYFRVVGVASQMSDASIGARVDDSFIIPGTTMRRTLSADRSVHFFVFTASPGHKPADNFPSIRRTLAQLHSFHPSDEQAVGTMDISEMFEMISKVFLSISLLAFFVGFGTLMAGVIGVGNIMWIIVKERTHEFGIRRAIGAKPADITGQVLSESVLLTLVSGTAGVCFATLVLYVADKVTYQPLLGYAGFQISFGMAVGIVFTFFILGSLAGTLPAIKAMRIKPIEALRDK